MFTTSSWCESERLVVTPRSMRRDNEAMAITSDGVQWRAVDSADSRTPTCHGLVAQVKRSELDVTLMARR
jgi:hypothetical protein